MNPLMLVVALVTVVAVLLLPGLIIGPPLDASVFSAVGWRLAEGDSLYAEVWDHKPPGIYLPYAAVHLLTDSSRIAWGIIWTATVLCTVGAAMVVRLWLMREGTGAFAWLGAGLVALGASSYLMTLGGGLGESLAILPMALSPLAAVSQRWFGAGILAGLSIAISLQSFPVLGALAVLGFTGAHRTTLWRAALVISGVFAVGLVTALSVWLNGGLAAMADALVTYNEAYRSVPRREGARSAWSLVPWTVLVLLPLVLGVGTAVIERHRLASPRLALASAAWIGTGIVLIALQGRFYAHYATGLVVPLAILAGLGIDAMWSRLPRRVGPPALGVPLIAALVVSLAIGAAGARDEQEPIVAANERAAAVATELRSLTEAGEAIFVWGNDPRLYELAGRPPASRYVYLYPLLTGGYVTTERVAELAVILAAEPPAAIIDSGALEPGLPGLPPLLIDRPVATDGRDTDLLDPIRAFVSDHYRLVDTVQGWPVYLYTGS